MECPRRIQTLDGLRGLAALVVVAFHFPQVGDSQLAHLVHEAKEKSLSGSLAVDILYVLSGFLITRIILREIAEGRFSARNFLIKRGLRIFPIFYLTLLFLACLQPISHQWITAACFVSNYTNPFDAENHTLTHSWSLSLMEQFYTLWAMAFLYLPVATVRRIAWPWGPVVAVVAAAGIFLALEPQLAWKVVHWGLPFRMLSLLLGAALAFHEVAIRRWPVRRVLPGIFIAYAALLLMGLGAKHTGWSGFRWLGTIASSCSSLLVVQYVIMANERTGLLRRVLTSSLLTGVGQISYGLYLYHYIVLFLVFNPTATDPMEHTVTYSQALVLLLLSLGIPSLSYMVIERPCLQLKSRLTAKPADRQRETIPLPQAGAAATHAFYPAVLPKLLQFLRSAGRNTVAVAHVPSTGKRESPQQSRVPSPQEEGAGAAVAAESSSSPAAADRSFFEADRKAA